MRLENLLDQKKNEIMNDWFNRLIETYPPETAPFFKSQKDPFANPVGGTARRGIEGVYNELLGGMNVQLITSFLDSLIRIRAVQTMFSASQAVGFIFLLKKSIRTYLKKEIQTYQLHDALLDFEMKIDELALIGFDVFTACREKIADLRATELKDRTLRAFERAGLVVGES
ncbi:MAG: RsbRD N-terminal domain-containing protein [Desulfobacterales bacterium]|nr:RsbRD N-terminal domain-containing protein [Desulfobacterales bacterium]